MSGIEPKSDVHLRFWKTLPHWVCIFLLMFPPPLYAQIVADQNAHHAHQPQVLSAGQNVPVVNIQTPNGAGVSVNHYSQFDVPSQGAILNNARVDVNTVRAGHVKGNAALAGGTASLILNQVNSPNASQLKGFLEVAGDRASVVVANPSGMTCDGCGFINTPHATLTTGKPIFSGSGALEGYRVEGGTVTFQGSGLNSKNTDYTDVLARAVKVNAQVHAGKELRVVTGRNTIAQDGRAAPTPTPLEDRGDKPDFALDVAALGGMYAGHIYMAGTEVGVGTRIVGAIIADQGPVEMDVQGPVTVSGKIQGAKNIRVQAKGDVYASGTLLGQDGAVHVDASGHIIIGGLVDAKQNVTLKGKNLTAHKGSTLTAREGHMQLTGTEAVSVKGTAKALKGQLTTQGDRVDVSGTTLEAHALSFKADRGDVDLTGSTVKAGGRLKVDTTKKLITDGATLSAPKLEMSATSFSNVGGKLTHSGPEAFALKGLRFLDNTRGKIESKGASFTLEVGRLINTDGTLSHEGEGLMSITAAEDVMSTRGEISSNSNLSIEAAHVSNEGGLISGVKSLWVKAKSLININTTEKEKGLSSKGTMTLTLDEELNNARGLIRTGGAFTFTGGLLTNTDGTIATDSDLKITSGEIKAAGGLFKSFGWMNINTQGQSFDLTGGILDANGDVDITSGDLTTDRAKVTAYKKATLNVDTLHNHDGAINVTGNLEITASKDMINTQTTKETPAPKEPHTKGISSGGPFILKTGGTVDNSRGYMMGFSSFTLRSHGLTNVDGVIKGEKTTTIDTQGHHLDNTKGHIWSREALNVTSGLVTNIDGVTTTDGTLTITSGDIKAARGTFESLGAITINTQGQSFDLTEATVDSAHDLKITSGDLTASQAHIKGGQNVKLTTGKLTNHDGLIDSQGTLEINTQGHHLENTRGTLWSKENLTLKTGRLTNTDGTVSTDGSLKITSGEINAHRGRFASLGAMTINTQGQSFDVTGGSVVAGTFDPFTGEVIEGHDLEITSGDFTTDNAHIVGSKKVTLGVGTLGNRDGVITAKESMKITTTGDFINTQTTKEATENGQNRRKGISSTGPMDLIIGGNGHNSRGYVYSAGDFTLSSQNFTNDEGVLVTDGAMGLTTHTFHNVKGNVQSKAGLTLDAQGHDMTTTQGRFYTDGALKILGAKTVNADAGFIGAQGDLSLTASEKLTTTNTGEVLTSQDAARTKGLISGGKLTVDLGDTWDNTRGAVYAGGVFEVKKAGLVTNTEGSVFGKDSVSFSTSGVDNTRGSVSGKSLTVRVGDGTVTNTHGTLMARDGSLTLSGKDILNDEGLIQGKGDVTLNALEKISNTHSGAEKGIRSDQNLTLEAGTEIDNTQGRVASTGTLKVKGPDIRSNAGSFVSEKEDLSLEGKTLTLVGGTLFAPKKLMASFTDFIDASTGKIHSYDHVDITTKTLKVSSTKIPEVTAETPQDKGIMGRSVHIKAEEVDNTQGFIAANTDLQLHIAKSLTNTKGRLEGTKVDIKDRDGGPWDLVVENTGGSLFALERLDVQAARLSNDGSLTSRGDMNVDLLGDYTYTGGWSVKNDLTFSLTGGLTNQSALTPGGKLTLKTASIDNQTSGELVGRGGLEVHTGAFTNRGLVNGADGVIKADALTNMGTGRIYGDRLSIQATQVTNTVEDGRAGSIATRGDLHLGVGTLKNEKGALIKSLGHLSIGGSLDGQHNAQGKATRVENVSARMEATGDLSVGASYLLNKNDGLRHALHIEETFGPKEHLWQEEGWCQFGDRCEHSTYTRVEKPVITASDPALMSAGQRVLLNVDSGENDASQIVGGQGVFHHGAELKNTTLQVKVRQWDGWRTYGRGPDEIWDWRYEMVDYGHKERWTERSYAPTVTERTVEVLPPVVTLTSNSPSIPGLGEAGVTGGVAFDPRSVSAPVLLSLHTASLLEIAAEPLTATPLDHAKLQEVTRTFLGTLYHEESSPHASRPKTEMDWGLALSNIPEAPRPVDAQYTVRTVDFSPDIPAASLFTPRPEPTATYLVETDPAFTDRNTWLSSDVQLKHMGLDPALAQKRVGDGFYEQMLVRDQLIKLTGYRYFAGYRDDSTQYAALLASGVVFGKRYNLTPGIGLTGEQMAKLTSPIVWLVKRTVALKDGSVHEVLVPQVYAVVRPGAIRGDGALISGRQVKMASGGSLVNKGGTIAGQERTEIHGDTLANLMGRLGDGGQTTLTTREDLLNIGGTIQGGSVAMDVGRDFVSITTSRNHESQSGSEGNTTHVRTTTIDHVASVKATDGDGSLRITSGRDSLLTGTMIQNQGSGDTTVHTGRHLTTDTVQTHEERENTFHSEEAVLLGTTGASGRTHSVEIKSHGTQISGGGAVKLSSGGDSTFKNAAISSGGKTTLKSGGKTTFVDDIQTSFSQSTNSDVGLLWQKQKDTGSHKETVASTTITAAGGSSVQAGGGVVTDNTTPTSKTWSDKKESLTPTGSALVGLGITALTLLSGGTAAGALGITNVAAGAAVNAGAASFGTQLAINTINNKGDVGKALEDVSAKQVGVSMAAAGLSAGAIAYMTPGVTPRIDSNFKAGAGAGTKLADMGTTQSASFASTSTQATTASEWVSGFTARLPVYGVQTVTNVAANAVLADGDSQAIGNAALGSLATIVGSEATLPLGQAYHAGQLNPFVHKLGHAAVGAGTAAISGGNVAAGAAGAVVGELAGEVFLKTQTPTAINANLLTRQASDIGRITGGLAGLAAGGDVNTGANTGTVAAENNAAFAIPLAIAAGSAAYTAWQGDGNPLKGLEKIGAGNDPLSQAVSTMTEKGVELSAKNFPEAIQRAVQVLSAVGNAADATVTYVDDTTGQTVSKTWNSLDTSTQNMLKGAGKVLGVSLTAAQVAKVASISKGAQVAAGKVDEFADALNANNTLSKIEINNGMSFWNKTMEFNGNKVYQRDDLINANFVDSRGRTNLERMQKGLAPIGPDGKSLNLHHMLQIQDGPIAEITATFHKQNHSIIHINPSSIPSGIDRGAFDKWRVDYWTNRVNDFK